MITAALYATQCVSISSRTETKVLFVNNEMVMANCERYLGDASPAWILPPAFPVVVFRTVDFALTNQLECYVRWRRGVWLTIYMPHSLIIYKEKRRSCV